VKTRAISSLTVVFGLLGPLVPRAFGHAGSLDPSFNPGSGVDFAVSVVAIQQDGKVLLGGAFTQFDGMMRNRIVRLNTNGSLDAGFDPGQGPDDEVLAILPEAGGSYLVGGRFTTVGTETRNFLARLNAGGTLDLTFSVDASRFVSSLVRQPDGKVIVAGGFTNLGGFQNRHVGRLNTNGTVDMGFSADVGNNVLTVGLQADGKLIVGGQFTSVSGMPRDRIARLNGDGSLDNGYDPNADGDTVCAIVVQPDGRALVGGSFTGIAGGARNRIARLNTDGSLDTGFNPGTGADAKITAVALQPDGKVIVGGQFTSFDGVARNSIARLNANGSLDTSFDPGSGADGQVSALALQTDAKVVLGGAFANVAGTNRSGVARLHGNPFLFNLVRSGLTFSASVETVAGFNYNLEYLTSLAQTNWMLLLPAVPGDGTVKTLSDLNAVPPGRFYRLRAQQ
jgi:uncharacterized delta-60 repeat protein